MLLLWSCVQVMCGACVMPQYQNNYPVLAPVVRGDGTRDAHTREYKWRTGGIIGIFSRFSRFIFRHTYYVVNHKAVIINVLINDISR